MVAGGNHRLQKLALRGMKIPDDLFYELTYFIKRMSKSITNLDLSENQIKAEVFHDLLIALSRNKMLKFVDASNNHILVAAP